MKEIRTKRYYRKKKQERGTKVSVKKTNDSRCGEVKWNRKAVKIEPCVDETYGVKKKIKTVTEKKK
jgi:hypothetical protein